MGFFIFIEIRKLPQKVFIKLLLLCFTGVFTDKISLFEAKVNVSTVNTYG